MPQPQPWWERPQFCAESSPRGCHYSFFTQIECRTEIGDDGVPVKRCIKLHKKLLECPGRPPVKDEQKQELTTYGMESRESDGDILVTEDTDYLHGSSATRGPQAADVGQALDEVIQLAEDLQEGMMPSKSLRLDTPPVSTSAQPSGAQAPWRGGEGLLARFLQWRERLVGQQAVECSKVSENNQGGTAWQEYARDIQEI